MKIPTDKLGRVISLFLCKEGTRELDPDKIKKYLPYQFTLTVNWARNSLESRTPSEYYTDWIIANNIGGWYQTKEVSSIEKTGYSFCEIIYTFYFNNSNDAVLFRLSHGDEISCS